MIEGQLGLDYHRPVRYVDEYLRTAGGWRIARLELTVAWCEGNLGILGAGLQALTAT